MSKPTPVIDGRGVTSIAKNFIFLLGGGGVYFVTRFLYAVTLARVFGPEIYGMINYGMAWYLMFLPLTRMGLEVVLSRDVGLNRQDGERTAAISLTLRLLSILIVTVVYLIFSWFFEHGPASRLMVFVLAFALVGRSLAVWTENVYTAYEANQYSFRQQSVFRPLELVLGLMAAIIFKEALVVVICHGLVWCLEAAYGLIFIHKRILSVRFAAELSGSGRIFIQGLPIGAAMLLLTVPYQGPLIFFRHFTSAGDSLGQLALAMQVLFMLSNIPLALGSVSLPVLSRAAARRDGKDRVFAETMLRYSVLLGTVLALLGTALGPWLTTLIFGDKFSAAGILVGPVLWLMIPWAAGFALTRVMMAGRFDYQTLVAAAIGAICFSLTIREAISRYEAMGALWCAGVSMALSTLYLVIFLRRHLAIDLRSSLIKPGLAALSAVGLFYVINPLGLIVSLVGSLVIFAIGCHMLACLTPQDIMWFRQTYRWLADKLFLRA